MEHQDWYIYLANRRSKRLVVRTNLTYDQAVQTQKRLAGTFGAPLVFRDFHKARRC